jgi:integrase/recombinase XerC
MPELTKTVILGWLKISGFEPGPLFFTSLDRAGKSTGRLTGAGVYSIIRDLGKRVGISTRPQGLRHTAITEACKIAQARGMPLEEVLDFSRHANVQTLMLYRDRERNVQGYLVSLVANQ